MSRQVERIPLPAMSLGTGRELAVHRYGRAGARPKAYLQAALHADELPGGLVLHHLIRRLDEAAAAGSIRGEIVLVPVANPIGLGQVVGGRHAGRLELDGGENFNRYYPDLAAAILPAIESRLGADAAANVTAIRGAMLDALAARKPVGELAALRTLLLRLAVDADIALDLHCDLHALLHVYTGSHLWPQAADLVAQLGARACLLAAESGGEPFDEALSTPWWRLAERFGPAKPVPRDACLSATVELRGMADIDDATAAADASALFDFLVRRKLIAGVAAPLPATCCVATPLAGVDIVRASAPGIVAYAVALGATVKAGDLIAEIVDPAAADPARARTPLHTRADGIVFTRALEKLARPGHTVAKVAGGTPLPGRVGKLLDD